MEQERGTGVSLVPNLPCGVERFSSEFARRLSRIPVPNLPCGVESNGSDEPFLLVKVTFLICRVELKGSGRLQ